MPTIKPLKERILAELMGLEQRVTASGIIIQGENGKDRGIRPRWAKIYGLGPDVKDPELQIGKFILISHGRWTRGITVETPEGKLTLRKVDTNDILLISDEPMEDETMSDKVF